ncbi:MAG: hypothetical protein GX803_09975 [Lentisphaerae bacterium]|jgi:hypothetical protein|nr:hypothetical protein [Lentisphaerota bacterium]
MMTAGRLMMKADENVRAYLAHIGRKGGLKSRRELSSNDARNMVRLREARRAYRRYHARCFWYMKEDLAITLRDIPMIAKGLRQHGGWEGMRLAEKLCR